MNEFLRAKVMTKDFGKLVLDEMPDGIVITTLHGIVVYWNNGAESVFGYAVAEALQHSFEELVSTPDYQWRMQDEIQDLLQTEVSVHEALCRKKDGALIHVNLSFKVLSSEQQGSYVLISSKDITHLKA